MKNILFLWIIGCFVAFSCDKEEISDSQAGEFIKFYTNFPEFSAADVAVTEEGFAIVGTAKILGGEDDTWICLLRTDKFGNSVDSARIYGLSSASRASNIAYCLKALDDGGFGILGSTLNPRTGYRSVYFIRTDEKGDTLFTRTITRNGDLEAKYFDVSPDGSFYMTGYFNEPGAGHEIWWFGIDNLGRDIRNQRDFGFESDDEGTHLNILPDGRLVITGFTTGAVNKRAFMIITDVNAVLVKWYEFKSINNESGNCIFPLNDEYFILCTRNDQSSSAILLKKVDMAGTDTVRTENYAFQNTEVGKCLFADNQYVYILGTTTVNGSNTVISLIKSTFSGEVESRMEFGSGSRLSAAAFKRTNDGGFIIAGTNVHPEVNNTAVALIKTR